MQDVQVSLTDRLYQETGENFDYLFTPEVIAKLDAVATQADAGKLVTFEELGARPIPTVAH